MEVASDVVFNYLPKLLEMGPKAVGYVQDLLKVKELNSKINKISKENEEIFLKIGKEICNSEKP